MQIETKRFVFDSTHGSIGRWRHVTFLLSC
jgi:hypothetical protein